METIFPRCDFVVHVSSERILGFIDICHAPVLCGSCGISAPRLKVVDQ